MVNFYISVEKNAPVVYEAGQMITGSIIVESQEVINITALTLQFLGDAKVHWSSSHTDANNETTTEVYSASEKYFDHTVSLLGFGSGGARENVKQLPLGQSVFPFSYQLPRCIPNSFQGPHGEVRYYIKATIDRAWKLNHNAKLPFTVVTPLDLNHDPNNRLSITDNASKTLCCLCCASGPIQAQLHLSKSGYVPGEFMRINAAVENLSSSDMPSTKANLLQQVRYHATSTSRTDHYNVALIKGQGCRAGGSVEWNQTRMQIPPLPPSFLKFCNIIDINYFLEFLVVVPAGSVNLNLLVPITLGTVPLREITSSNAPPPVFTTNAIQEAFDRPSTSATAPPAYEQPPPSYETSHNMSALNSKEANETNYLIKQTTSNSSYDAVFDRVKRFT